MSANHRLLLAMRSALDLLETMITQKIGNRKYSSVTVSTTTVMMRARRRGASDRGGASPVVGASSWAIVRRGAGVARVVVIGRPSAGAGCRPRQAGPRRWP